MTRKESVDLVASLEAAEAATRAEALTAYRELLQRGSGTAAEAAKLAELARRLGRTAAEVRQDQAAVRHAAKLAEQAGGGETRTAEVLRLTAAIDELEQPIAEAQQRYGDLLAQRDRLRGEIDLVRAAGVRAAEAAYALHELEAENPDLFK